MRKILLAALAALLPAVAIAGGPNFSNSGGIGNGAYTPVGPTGEPCSGGAWCINGATGVATLGGIALPSQTANKVFASPVGASGVPAFRALASADIPAINVAITGAGGVTGTLPVTNGGTGAASASGAALDNIAGFAGTGLIRRTGAGAYSVGTTVSNAEMAMMAANTIKGNGTGSTGAPTDLTGAAVYKLLPARCQNILAYGGDNGGSVDNFAAFNAAVAASPTGQICVYFPAGTYLFSSSPQISVPSGSTTGSAAIMGDGQDVTVIKMAAHVQGPTILLNARNQTISVRNLTIAASAVETSVAGLFLGMNVDITAGPSPGHNNVENVTIRGIDGYNVADTFFNGLTISGLSNVNVRNVGIFGGCGPGYCGSGVTTTGINTIGTANRIPVALNFSQIDVFGMGEAFLYGAFVQGVTITQANFLGGFNGIILPPGSNGNDQLAVGLSHMNNANTDIFIAGNMDGISIVACNLYLLGGGSAAINISGGEATITGNAITQLSPGTAGTGVVIAGPFTFSKTITGNTFRGFANGVWLQSGSTNTNVQSNAYLANTTNVLNQGTGNTVGGGSQ